MKLEVHTFYYKYISHVPYTNIERFSHPTVVQIKSLHVARMRNTILEHGKARVEMSRRVAVI